MPQPVPRYKRLLTYSFVGSPSGGVGTYTKLYDWKHEGLLVSEGHYRRPNGSWSGGGPFYVYKSTMTRDGGRHIPFWRNGVTVMSQLKSCIPSPVNPPPFLPPSWASVRTDLTGHYATGYAKTRPGKPLASLGQFLVELRDLPTVPLLGLLKAFRYRKVKVPVRDVPAHLREQLGHFRNIQAQLVSEYLNIVFGWKPFVNDLRKMYHLWHTIDARMAQIIRENGRYIRRRATLSDETVTSQTSTQYAYPFANVYGSPPNYATGTSLYTVTNLTKTKVWFVGSYRYYIPDVGSSQWDVRARAALFGALPTPELLWEVMPWSWLIDWFSNVGDVVSNASMNAVDNLTLRYSFVMKHVTETKITQCDTTWQGANNVVVAFNGQRFGSVWPGGSHAFYAIEKIEKKARTGGGNPFGLNVSLNSLSSGQLAILAALGLSRSSVR